MSKSFFFHPPLSSTLHTSHSEGNPVSTYLFSTTHHPGLFLFFFQNSCILTEYDQLLSTSDVASENPVDWRHTAPDCGEAAAAADQPKRTQ